jgi:hypothetical protein
MQGSKTLQEKKGAEKASKIKKKKQRHLTNSSQNVISSNSD